jgi:hypothetical protein
MTPTDPPSPKRPPGDKPEQAPAQQVPENEGRRGPRPGGHGSYKIGGEPATGQTWHEAPPPPPAPSAHYVPPTPADRYVPPPPTKYDDGVMHDPHVPGDLLHNVDVDHEHADVNIRGVIGSAIAMFVVVVVAQVAMWALFAVFERQAAASDPAVSPLAAPPVTMPKSQAEATVFSPETVPAPQLLANEPRALQQQHDMEQKVLHGYGWVNQGAGVARIPIDQAMKLIVERGLPVREGEEVSPTLGTRLPARGESSGGRGITMGAPEAQPEAPAKPPEGSHGQEPAPGGQPAKPRGPGGH